MRLARRIQRLWCRSTCSQRILHPPNSLFHLLPNLQFNPSLQWHLRTQLLSGWRCPSRTRPRRRDNQNWFTTYSLVNFALALNSAFGQFFMSFRQQGLSFPSILLYRLEEISALVVRSPALGSRCQYVSLWEQSVRSMFFFS